MDEEKIEHILIEILRVTVNGTEDNELIKEKVTPDIILLVYRLAKKHDLAHVVSAFVYRNKIKVNQNLQNLLQQEEIKSVYRSEQMKYTYLEICSVFDEMQIVYIPLKGAVIRPYYPYENMRTSCDIDILIHEEDIDSAINALKKRKYCCGKRDYHNISLFSPNKIHLELHFNILENTDNLDAVLKDAWEYAIPTNSSQYAFSNEFFAFYIFAHMAYHFVSGGCGIRSLLDIWVLEQKMGISYLCAEELLQKAGIYKFASEMSKLAKQCFSKEVTDSFNNPILKYIFRGGVYGSKENHIAVNKSKNNSSVIYAIKRLFLSYKTMVIAYPILKNAPFLLPICWFERWIKAVFGGKSKRIVSEMTYANNISEEKIKEIREIRSRLGI